MKTKYTCVIVDDSLMDCTLLETLVGTFSRLEIVKTFTDSVAAIKGINELQPHIVLSDIEMPVCSGIELVKSLNYKPSVIFLSSHREFGAEVYETDAMGYLIRPVAVDKFSAVINKVINRLDQESTQSSDIFIIRTESQYIPINKADITHVEAEDKFVKIYLQNNQQHIVWISLKSLLEQLTDKRFMRIHRSYIINTEHISSINNVDVKIAGRSLPLSEQYKPELFDVFVKRHLIKK